MREDRQLDGVALNVLLLLLLLCRLLLLQALLCAAAVNAHVVVCCDGRHPARLDQDGTAGKAARRRLGQTAPAY